MSDLVTYRKEGDVLMIIVDNPPVNALSPGVPEGIAEGIEKLEADGDLKAGVLTTAGRTFIAGADITQFGKMMKALDSGERPASDRVGLNPIIDKIEGSSKPVVAAIHGMAFGGGLEFAMGCHYRIALDSAKVGQPEVKLGIIPGAGGTQRLPRLCGPMKAVEMCAQGNPVKAPEALSLGILDKVIEGDLEALYAAAIEFAREKSGESPRRTRDLDDKLGDEKTNGQLFQMARMMTEKKGKGYLAPFKAIDAVEAATKLPFDEGVKREAELFVECLLSPQAKALIHLFFSERASSKVPGIGKDVKKYDIKKAGIIGAGTMGGGIAMVYANAGFDVVIKEVKQEFLDRGMGIIDKNYESRVKKGKMTAEKKQATLDRIKGTLDYADLGDCDIVVEAAFEKMDVKKEVFGELDKVCKADCILASNTSTLDIDAIAASTKRPEMVIGHHFFSPANVMPLLEVVRGEKTSDEVIATSMALGKKLRKTPVLVGNCFGFVGNRMIGMYSSQAQFLLEEGCTPEQIDKAMEDFGMAMGPCRMSDLAGVDVSYLVKQTAKDAGIDKGRDSKIIDKLYEAGRYGQKTSKGYYKYEEGSRAPVPDPEVVAMIEEVSKEAGIERRDISDDEIVDRLIYALVNEGAKILEEGYASRASDIDIIYIFGYGFPPFRGGPMFYADQQGLDKVLARIEEFGKSDPGFWEPAPLLVKLAGENKKFQD